MPETHSRPLSRADAIANWCFRHWLLVINIGVLLYAAIAWLAPVLEATGYPQLGRLLFQLYTPFCHQRPERSFFVLGQQVAICHRETAMYALTLLGGVCYAPLRDRLRPLGGWLVVALLLPMLLDGGTHALDDLLALGVRGGGDAIGTLNWWLRMFTAALFALAVVLGVYPRLERDLRRPLVETV